MALRRKAAAAKAGDGVSELDNLIDKGPEGAYEALQLFRSRALRFKTKGDLKSAITAASHGAKSLLRARETGRYLHAGSELTALLVNLLDESGAELDSETRTIINDIDTAFELSQEVEPASTLSLRTDFLKSCIKWSQASGTRELGDPQLHVRLGNCLWGGSEGKRDIKQAIYHFVAGEAPVPVSEKICATFGTDIVKRDQNLVLAIMHFLAMENLRDANELLQQFKKDQKTRNAPMDSALITFVTQLLEVCRRDATPLFKTLVNANLKLCDFDDTVGMLLSGPIGQKFFNIQPKINPMMQMMQQLLT